MAEVQAVPISQNLEEPKSILVIKPSSFGDVIHTLPAVSRLKLAWPNARLAWVVNPEWAPLLSGNPFIDEVILFPRRELRGLSGLAKFARWCRQAVQMRRPDLVIDFQGLLRSALIGRASEGQDFVGMSDAREGGRWFYGHVVRMPTGKPHAVERYLATVDATLSRYGVEPAGDNETLRWPLPVGTPFARNDADAIPDGFILLHPFARGQGKSLSTNDIQRLCLSMPSRRVVIVGQARDSFHDQLPAHCVSLLGQTSLEQLIWLVHRASFVISVDSGPSHLAAALKRPMVTIHTWSDPRQVGPYRKDAWVWKNKRLLRMRQLSALDESFFSQTLSHPGPKDFEAIAEIATSS